MQYSNAARGEWVDASPRADLDRITRQQGFIRKLADVAARQGASNPLTALDIADAIVPKLKVDQQLTKQEIFQLVNTFRKVNPEDNSAIEMITLPVQSATDGNRVVVKQPDASQVLARLRTFGTPSADEIDPKLLPSQVRVRVLNASGVEGAAGEALAGLQRYSFAPAGVGNARRLSATEIHYRPNNEDKGKLVARYLGGVGRLVSDDSISDADVVVMLAKDFQGITAPAGAKTTARSHVAGGSSAAFPTHVAPSSRASAR